MKKTFTKTMVLTGFPMALLCCLLTFGWTNATAQPIVNDECSNSTVLTPSATCSYTSSTNLGATPSAQADACAGTYNDDVWFSFTAVAAEATITVDGSASFDAVFEVLEGTCGTQTSLACVDGSGSGGIETTTLTTLVVGQVYYVRVAHYFTSVSTTNTFDICVVSSAPCQNNSQYPSSAVAILSDGTLEPIATNYFVSGEYSELSGIQAFHSYELAHSSAAYITVYSGTTQIGAGLSPLTVTAPNTDNLFVHYTDDDACAITLSGSFNEATVQDLTPGLCSSTSINYSYCPAANDATEWLFEGANPGEMPSVLFNAGSMENCCDDVTVYDGTSTSDPVLYVSTSTGGDLTGTLVTSTTGNLLIVVSTDGSVQCSSSSSYDALDFDVLCGAEVIPGCTDPAAINYNALATVDDASCIIPTCADPAINYTYCPVANDATEWLFEGTTLADFPTIVFNAGSFQTCCDDITIYDGTTTSDPVLFNGTGDITGTAVISTSGNLLIVVSTDGSAQCSSSSSYDALDFDVLCGVEVIPGCTDPAAINYNALATVDDASCIIPACTTAVNQTLCYDNGADNQFLYVPATPGDLPAIYINAGTIEVNWDDITIYDGTSTSDPVLFTGDGDVSGTSVVSTSGFLLVVVTSDGSGSCVSSTGYTSLDWDVYCGLPCEATDAGTITADASPVCLASGTATISATANGDQVVPTGYVQVYVLTDGTTGVILDANPAASFDVTAGGNYIIHTAVYNPLQFDPGTLPLGTTGQEVFDMTIAGGGTICASLDLTGAAITVNAPDYGTASATAEIVCLANGTATISVIPTGDATIPTGYSLIGVLADAAGNLLDGGDITYDVTAAGDYYIHVGVVADADIAAYSNETTLADLIALTIDGGGSLCGTVQPTGTLITVQACPDNDECSGAISLTVGQTCTPTAGDVANATESEPGCAGTADDDVWYSFTATAETATLDVQGSANFDAVVEVFAGTGCGALTSLGCLDGSGTAGLESANMTGMTIGDVYYVRVYHYFSSVAATTTFDICVYDTPPAPANDDCAGATPLTVGTSCVTTEGTVESATESLASCNGGNANDDVWYSFVADAATATVEVTGASDFDAVLEVFDGACGSTSLGCIDNTGDEGTESTDLTGLVSGTTYYFRVYHYYTALSTTPTFDVCVYNVITGISNNDLATSLSVYPNPSNGQFVVEVNGIEATAELTVIDIAGRQVYTEGVTMNGSFRKELNLEVAKGTYLLQIATVDGMVTRKIQIN